jgi:hypothetical protein
MAELAFWKLVIYLFVIFEIASCFQEHLTGGAFVPGGWNVQGM